MIGDIVISDHAVERFVQRHAPEMSFNEAKSLLIRRSLDAVPLKQKTINGDNQWQISNPDIVLVGKYVRGRVICKTILPEAEFKGIPEEEIELMQEYADDRASDRNKKIEQQHAKTEEQLLLETLTLTQRFELEQQRIAAENRIEMVRYQIMREYLASKRQETQIKERLAGAINNSNNSRHNITTAIKIAVSTLVKLRGNKEVDYALAEIQRIDPAYLDKDFLK